MDKRTFLKSFAATATKPASLSLSTLQAYSGPWETAHATHLLNRSIFGPTIEQIKTSVSDGIDLTIEKLFEEIPHPEPPVYYNFENDPQIDNFETWVYTGGADIQGLDAARRRSLYAWHIGLFKNTGINIREKMTLFWNEHIPIGGVVNPRVLYQYLNLFRTHATGNFKALMYDITVSPGILDYLNGTDNVATAPNDNYARELLELFTLGRGEQVAPGDYTNYTEQDVEAASRVLTGWRIRLNDPSGLPSGVFNSPRHDQGTKQLSHRFDNVVIENGNEEEYKTLIDIIFSKSEVARFICRKLHIWFVGSDINEDVELNIIEPMAQMLIDNGYNIKEPLRALLASEYFNDAARRGCMLSSPIDFLMKLVNTYKFTTSDSIQGKYFIWLSMYNLAVDMGMNFVEVPTVAGWKAYYQTPQFYQFWINSVTLNQRDQLIQRLVDGINIGDISLELNFIDFVAEIENAADPNVMIQGIADYSFVTPLSQNQLDYLKDVLIPGLPDFEWTIEYTDYLEDPNNPAKSEAIKSKLRTLFNAVLRMPEFSLM